MNYRLQIFANETNGVIYRTNPVKRYIKNNIQHKISLQHSPWTQEPSATLHIYGVVQLQIEGFELVYSQTQQLKMVCLCNTRHMSKSK